MIKNICTADDCLLWWHHAACYYVTTFRRNPNIVGCSKSTVPPCERHIAEKSNIQSYLTICVMTSMLQYCFLYGVHQTSLAEKWPKFGSSMALNILTLSTVFCSVPVSSVAEPWYKVTRTERKSVWGLSSQAFENKCQWMQGSHAYYFNTSG